MIRKTLVCPQCGAPKPPQGLMFCSRACSKKYRQENIQEIKEKIAERITKKDTLLKLIRYIPMSWEKDSVNRQIRDLQMSIDELDYQLGDY